MNATLKFTWCEFAKVFLSRAPAGSVRLLGLIGGGEQSDLSWQSHPQRIRVFWDRHIKCWVKIDLADWGGRWYYFTGRYYDANNQWLIRRVIKPGGWYIDIGANIGIHTLFASRLAGASGRILAIEPNPDTIRHLKLHIALNDATNVVVYPCAFGNKEGRIELFIDTMHSGTASVRPGVHPGEAARLSTCVELRRGDDLLPRPSDSVTCLVKIDVEGSEFTVIKGMEWWLDRLRTCFVIEVTPEWIRQVDGSAEELFNCFHQRGYRSYWITRKSKLYHSGSKLIQVNKPLESQRDYVFVRKEESRLFNID